MKTYREQKNNEASPTSGGEGGEYHPHTPHSYHGTNPQYHPGSRGRGGATDLNSAGNTPSIGFGNNINNDVSATAPPLPSSQPPPPPASNSMGVISDAPQANVDTKENKRHTLYNPIPSATNGHSTNINGYGHHDTSNERFYESPHAVTGASSNAPVSVDDVEDTPDLPPANFGALVSSMIRSSSKDNDNTDDTGPTQLRMATHTTSHTKHDNERGTSTTQETTMAAASISKKLSTTTHTEEYSRKISSVSKKSSSKEENSDDDNDNDDSQGGTKILADSSIPPVNARGIVPTEKDPITEGEVVSSSTITSRSRTVETTTYSLEREGEGEAECHVEQKVTIQSDGDPIDHDEALAQAIQEATAMNPDMTVEKIEIHQTSAAPES